MAKTSSNKGKNTMRRNPDKIPYWGDLENKQRKQVVLWLEDHFGKLFGEELGYGNKYDKPPVPKGTMLSTKRVYSEKSLGFYAHQMLQNMYQALTLDSVLQYDIPYVEKIEMRQPLFIGYDAFTLCHNKEDMEKEDEKFFGFIGKYLIENEKMTKEEIMKKNNEYLGKNWTDRRYEYVVALELDGVKSISDEGYRLFEHAVGTARTSMILWIPYCSNEKYRNMLKSEDWDWSKQGLIEVPKIEYVESMAHSSDLWCIEGASFYNKVINGERNDEFIEFAKSLKPKKSKE